MCHVFRRLGQTLPAAVAIATLAACDSTSMPTASQSAGTTQATAATGAPVTSIAVRGSVVDSFDRPVANAVIECVGEVRCIRGSDITEEGHEHRATKTDENGLYGTIATSQALDGTGGFMMNANGRGYEVSWRSVEWPDLACTSDQARCSVTVHFRLAPIADGE